MLWTIASGDAATAIGLVGADRYVDHNPAVADSPVGLSDFVRAALGLARVRPSTTEERYLVADGCNQQGTEEDDEAWT